MSLVWKTQALEQVVRYFGRCYLNAGNGTRAKEQYKLYMQAVGLAISRIRPKAARRSSGRRETDERVDQC